MSNLESLYGIRKPKSAPAAYLNGSQNHYAFLGLPFNGNTKKVDKETERACKILSKSKNCGQVNKFMLVNKLKNTRDVITNDYSRCLYDIEYQEKNLVVPMPHLRKLDNLTEVELENEKKHFQSILSSIKAEVTQLQADQEKIKLRKIPEKYNHITAAVDAEALYYEVPESQINISLLRRKLKAQDSQRNAIGTMIIDQLKTRLITLHREAGQICVFLHVIDRTIERIQLQL